MTDSLAPHLRALVAAWRDEATRWLTLYAPENKVYGKAMKRCADDLAAALAAPETHPDLAALLNDTQAWLDAYRDGRATEDTGSLVERLQHALVHEIGRIRDEQYRPLAVPEGETAVKPILKAVMVQQEGSSDWTLAAHFFDYGYFNRVEAALRAAPVSRTRSALDAENVKALIAEWEDIGPDGGSRHSGAASIYRECAQKLKAALRAAPAAEDEAAKAHSYLSRLLLYAAPQCEPLPDLLGLCTQIDNVLTGLVEYHRAAAPQEP